MHNQDHWLRQTYCTSPRGRRIYLREKKALRTFAVHMLRLNMSKMQVVLKRSRERFHSKLGIALASCPSTGPYILLTVGTISPLSKRRTVDNLRPAPQTPVLEREVTFDVV